MSPHFFDNFLMNFLTCNFDQFLVRTCLDCVLSFSKGFISIRISHPVKNLVKCQVVEKITVKWQNYVPYTMRARAIHVKRARILSYCCLAFTSCIIKKSFGVRVSEDPEDVSEILELL